MRTTLLYVPLFAVCGLALSASCFTPDNYPGAETTGNAGGQGGTTSGSGGGGGRGGAAGHGGSGGQGTGGGGVLMDRALLVRYFINEADGTVGADAGSQVSVLKDWAAASMVNLSVVPGMGGPALESEGIGHWGLSWKQTGKEGKASSSINGNKVSTFLNGVTQATIELVVKVQAVAGGDGSPLISIGTSTENLERFSLVASSTSAIKFLWDGDDTDTMPNTVGGAWTIPDLPSSRQVLHLVLDTTFSDSASRVALYVGGQPAMSDNSAAPTSPVQLEGIELTPTTDYLVLGNRESGARSFQGMLYYAALYTAALTPQEVADNAAVLAGNDNGS